MKLKLSIAILVGIIITSLFFGCSDNKPLNPVQAMTPPPFAAGLVIANSLRHSNETTNNNIPIHNNTNTSNIPISKMNDLITVRYNYCDNPDESLKEIDKMISSGYHPINHIQLSRGHSSYHIHTIIITWGK